MSRLKKSRAHLSTPSNLATVRQKKGKRWNPRGGSYSSLRQDAPKSKSKWWKFIMKLLEESRDELIVVAAATAGTLIRAMGVQVKSGTAGLLFTNGRATLVLRDGFRPLIPFLQQVVIVPIRARTMDLPSQRVVNRDGLVYHADANLVYHIHDVHKAVIEIDLLEKGMLQMLTLGVQEVLRDTNRDTVRDTATLSKALEDVLTKRLADWGVTVDKAGFPSLTPSPQTLRITQLNQQVEERKARYETFINKGHGSARSLALVGPRRFPRPRRVRSVREEYARRWKRQNRLRIGRENALKTKKQKEQMERPAFPGVDAPL